MRRSPGRGRGARLTRIRSDAWSGRVVHAALSPRLPRVVRMTMTYRRLGDSGLTVSTAGLGCNTFGATLAPDGVSDVVTAALDVGITLVDTADVYGGEPGQSEELLGAALRGCRDDVVIATKFGMDVRRLNGDDWGARGSRRYVRRAIEGSLRRLGTDRYNHLDRAAEADLVPAAEHVGVGVLPYVPLASGLLTGKYRRGEQPPAGSRLARMPHRLAPADFDRIEALHTLAHEWGIDLVTVALGGGWLPSRRSRRSSPEPARPRRCARTPRRHCGSRRSSSSPPSTTRRPGPA